MQESELRNESEHLWRNEFPRINVGDGEGGAIRDRKLASYAENLWWLGWADGAVGQPPEEGADLVQTHARARIRLRRQDIMGEIAQMNAEASVASAVADYIQEQIIGTQEEIKEITDQRRKNPHELSLVTGLIYLLVAFVLMVADMPLSLRLVADGFDMPVEYRVPFTKEVITFGDVFVPANRTMALIHLWEPIVLALGIAGLGIFFKIVSDYLLSTAPLLQQYPILVKSIKAIFFTAAFLLMIAGLICVGSLRAAQQSASLARKSKPSAGSTSILNGVQNAPTSTSTPPARAAAQKNVDFWAKWSFVLLAIALPAIGGICFSIGWKRIQQSLARFSRLAWIELMWVRLRRHRTKAAILTSRCVSLAEEVKNLNEGTGDDVTPLKLYMHGYVRGFTGPQKLEPHRTLHARCKEVLHYFIAAGVQEDNIDRVRSNGGMP